MAETCCPKCGHRFWVPGDPDLEARHWPEACQAKICTYFIHYLKHSKPGQPDIPHAAYHAAERDCERAQTYALSRDSVPPSFERYLTRLEARVRA